jgi:K(+)-stimulated pyrophosphate-energized sodium pump
MLRLVKCLHLSTLLLSGFSKPTNSHRIPTVNFYANMIDKNTFSTVGRMIYVGVWFALVGWVGIADARETGGLLTEPADALADVKIAADPATPTTGSKSEADVRVAGGAGLKADATSDKLNVPPSGEISWLFFAIPVCGLAGLIYTAWRAGWVAKQEVGNEKMALIARSISEGAMSFLRAEYSILLVFVACVAALLCWSATRPNQAPYAYLVAVSFGVGALCSGLAGFIGMRVATMANVRTTNAARTGLGKALEVAFAGGSVMGMGVVGLGLLGLGVLFLIYSLVIGINSEANLSQVITVLTGFSFGASSIALFARVGGGIYTKAADVGADLVGKVEAGIPEDHPLNPATIADNVGDNVGDVAGMGADLFESYVGSIIGTMVLGVTLFSLDEFRNDGFSGMSAVLLPLVLAGVGILTSIVGTFFVRVKEGGNPQTGLNLGEFGSAIILLILTYFIIQWMLPSTWKMNIGEHNFVYTSHGVFYAICFGLFAGLLIGKITEHYTGTGTGPVKSIVRQSVTGPATNIICGLGVGMFSTALPILVLVVAIVGAYSFAGLYGIAIAAVGMLSNTGIQLAVDAYGPISDNAGGIAQMADLPPEVRQRTDKLDAVGNTTAAIGKGFAIGSAALTALALFAAYKSSYDLTHKGFELSGISITDPYVMAGLFVGAMLPFLFSAMAMNAVGRAANSMITEVRRQFKDIPELAAALKMMTKNEGRAFETWSKSDQDVFEAANGKAEYGKCVAISTRAAIREMVLPGVVAVSVPVAFGYFPSYFADWGFSGVSANTNAMMLGGLLAGVTVTGVLMALFQSNAGGAWDNAKKMLEEGFEHEGKLLKKGSEAHKAAVVGDTVGDPFKDTSGPSLNILLKLMSIVAVVIAPFLPLCN